MKKAAKKSARRSELEKFKQRIAEIFETQPPSKKWEQAELPPEYGEDLQDDDDKEDDHREPGKGLDEDDSKTNWRNFDFPAIEEGPRVPDRPLWMPEGVDLKRLPVEIRQAAEEIVQPAYEQLVLHVAPGWDQSLGASIVHLLWLEILDQFDIKSDYSANSLALRLPPKRQRRVEHHIKLLDAKLRHGKFMLQLEQFRLRAKTQAANLQASISQSPPIASAYPALDALAAMHSQANDTPPPSSPRAEGEKTPSNPPASPGYSPKSSPESEYDELQFPGYGNIRIPRE
jgi:hypothetical protein